MGNKIHIVNLVVLKEK